MFYKVFFLQMPQKYKMKSGAKPRECIPPEIMKAAVDKVLTGAALHTTAKEYGLSRNTLRRYVRKVQSGNETSFSSSYKNSQIFSVQEEEELAKYLELMARMNHGLTTKLIDRLAYDLAVKNKKKYPETWDRDKRAGYFWRQGFLDRNPQLSLKKPEATSLSRATSFNKTNVSAFFENLTTVLAREKFGPENIWNADETGVTTVQKCPKVIAPKKLRQVGHVTSAERGQTVTICNAVNALGNSIPPFFIFPRMKTNPAFLFGAPPGSAAAAHISGWMTPENFPLFLEHFVKFTKCSKEKKTLLILDNHESHISLTAIDYARANGIVLLTFPPHCSHRLQPLDVGVYSAFKNYYNQQCSNRITVENPGVPLTIYNIAEMVGRAFPLAFTPANITSGFMASGIYPLNTNKFTDADFLCASVTDRPYEEELGYIESENPAGPSGQPPTESDVLPSTSIVSPVQGPSTSGFAVSPQDILPYPKAGKRKLTNRGKKKGKTMVATDTPNKNEIEIQTKKREEKKKLKEERKVKKALFTQGLGLPPKGKKKKTIFEDSETSESEIELSHSSDSDCNFLDFTIDSRPTVNVNDWAIVKFSGKRNIRRFVGFITEHSDEEFTVKFARRITGNKFKWPEVNDISVVDVDQIESRLDPPQFSYQNDRVTSFEFRPKFKFPADVE